jgi:cell division protein FtsB
MQASRGCGLVTPSRIVVLSLRVATVRSRISAKRRIPTSTRPWRIRRIVQLLLIFAAVVTTVDGLVGDRGLPAMLRARHEYDDLAASIARQRAENGRLREEARRLREDPAMIEEIARRELGLIRPGEKVFIVKDVPPPTGRK